MGLDSYFLNVFFLLKEIGSKIKCNLKCIYQDIDHILSLFIYNADTLYYLIQTKSWKGICYRIINIKIRPAAYFFNKLFMQIWSVVLCITYFLSIYGGNVLFLWTSRWIISRLTVLLSMNIMQSRYLLLLLITSWNNGNTVSFSILWTVYRNTTNIKFTQQRVAI